MNKQNKNVFDISFVICSLKVKFGYIHQRIMLSVCLSACIIFKNHSQCSNLIGP